MTKFRDDTSSGTIYSIRAVHRVCDILDLIQESPEAFSLTQVAEVTAFPKSSAFRYLATLEERRYVQRDPMSGMYRIGPAFLPLQSRQLNVLADLARPHLRKLRDRFSETLNLGMLDGNLVSYVEIVESPKAVRLAARLGDRDPLHCTALGKAIASTQPFERVEAILAAEGMPRRTATTITDISALRAELDSVRANGYAVDDCEYEDEGRCVAVPLVGIGLAASISFSAPAMRFPMSSVPEVAQALKDAAALLVTDFAGSATPSP